MALIVTAIIRAHQDAAGAKKGADNAIGPLVGGLSTKINAMVYERGLSVCLMLTPGQQNDSRAACVLLNGLLLGTIVNWRPCLWQQRSLGADGRCRRSNLCSNVEIPKGAAHHRRCTLSSPQSYRSLLQDAQALPPDRYTIPQTRQKLPRCRHSCVHHAMD